MINDLTILGNVGKDAESKTTSSQKEVVSFSIAHSRGKDKQTGEEKSFWINVTVFEGNSRWWVDQAKSVRKGDKVLVKGPIELRTYIDKNGASKQSLDIIANSILIIPRTDKPQAPAVPFNSAKPVTAPPSMDFMNMNDIPF